MTRPYTRTKQVQTTMRPADVDRLDALADQLAMSRANLIHEAILEKLQRHRSLEEKLAEHFAPPAPEADDERRRVEEYQKKLRDLRAQREALR